MNAFFTAVIISLFMMMASALVVLIWEIIDNKGKGKIDLGESLHARISNFLDTEDKDEIKKYVQDIVISHLEGDHKWKKDQ